YASEFFLSKTLIGKIEYQFTKFSLFYGIELQQIKIQNLPENGGDTIFTASRIALLYNLPAILLAKVRISEIAIEKPQIYLSQKDGVWNFEHLLPKEVDEKKEEVEEETGQINNDEVNLFLPIHIFFKAYITELEFHYLQEEKGFQKKASLENLNFSLLLETERFSKLPLSLKALQILDNLQIYLNPTQDLKLYYSDSNEIVNAELILRLILENSKKQNSNLKNEIRLATKTFQITQGNQKPKDFQFDIGLTCFLDSNTDEVFCEDFHFIFDNDKWINVNAKVTKLNSTTPDIQLQVSESKIVLSDLNPLFSSLPMPKFQIGGVISLNGIRASGDMDHLLFTGKISGKNIFYKQETSIHEVSNLNLHFDSVLNLSDKSESTETDILPILEDFNLHELSLIYNGISLSLNGRVIPKSLVDLTLNVKNIYLEKFTPQVSGRLDIFTKIAGSKLSYLNIDLKGVLSKLRYKMGRGTSGVPNVDLHIVTTIDLKGGFALEDLQIEPFELIHKNENSQQALQFVSHLDLDLKQGLKAKIFGLSLKTNMTNLLPTLPTGLKNTISAIRSGLGNELILKGETLFESFKEKDHINLHFGGSFPALELNDLGIDVDIFMHKDKAETLEIRRFSLNAFDQKLKALFSGKFYKPFTPNPPFGDKTGEFKGNLTLESEIPRHVLKGIHFQGDIDFNLDLKGRYVKGELKSQNSNIQIQPSCSNPPCPRYEIKGLFLDIPIAYDLQDVSYEKLTQGNKEAFVQNYGFTKPSNFKIQAIEGSHPIYPERIISYITPSGDSAGLSGFIEFRDNFLTIDNLKIYTLNGVIFARDILFNLADASPENMEFAGVLQIRDIDVKPLLDERAQNKIDDGKLKGDLTFSGSNLNDPIGNTDLSFSIFQIGRDFGKSVVNIISPTNIITDFIINSYSVNRVEIELTKGLVYAKVKFNKSILNKIAFSIENDELKQERIPLASFLNRAKSELEAYNR
ncbi:MAG: hypothetical protein N3A69_05965, partial [Leptospiraceae bacterium]|nr:hypothetical protein [Leptospiraceae bacterium]